MNQVQVLEYSIVDKERYIADRSLKEGILVCWSLRYNVFLQVDR